MLGFFSGVSFGFWFGGFFGGFLVGWLVDFCVCGFGVFFANPDMKSWTHFHTTLVIKEKGQKISKWMLLIVNSFPGHYLDPLCGLYAQRFSFGSSGGTQVHFQLVVLRQKYLYRPKIYSLVLRFFLPIKNSKPLIFNFKIYSILFTLSPFRWGTKLCVLFVSNALVDPALKLTPPLP